MPQADQRGPEFHTTYHSTAQSVTVVFSTLDLVLHQGVILSLLGFFRKLQPKPEEDAPDDKKTRPRRNSDVSISSFKSFASAKESFTTPRPKKTKKTDCKIYKAIFVVLFPPV